MNQELRMCQNCKQEFTVEPEDFDFYEKIKVPAPTFCPECRLIRRFLFRNERAWYRRMCDATGKPILAMMSPDGPYKVYEHNYWRSDAWDPMEYGRDYDFSRTFFEQFNDLFKVVPHPNLIQKNNVDSEYSNHSLNLKNCYFCISTDTGEDGAYLFTFMLRNRRCVDGHMSYDVENCYEIVDCYKCSYLRFCQLCEGCIDSWFLYDCRNCTNCVGCVGLRNKQYCIFNKQYSKEEYQQEFKKLNLLSFAGLLEVKHKFEDLKLSIPRKFATIIKSENAIGDDIQNSKNVRGFTIRADSENIRYGYRISSSRDVWDGVIAWNEAELEYEILSCSAQNVLFSSYIWGGFNIQYSHNCFDCNNVFGCVGLRSKSYCILNKQYSKEEYGQLLPQIIEHMKARSYKDLRGIEYRYGEFFPVTISPFVYNETIAQDYFPLTKEQIVKKGYSWRDEAERNYRVTIQTKDIPDAISDVENDILQQVIACSHAGSDCGERCAEAFKMIPFEVQFYKQIGVPLPRLCPNCRHFQRVKQKPPLKLCKRKCQCSGSISKNKKYNNSSSHIHGSDPCPNEFETAYAPDRLEIIYCEQCYNAEVV